jgi:hypothetical protein
LQRASRSTKGPVKADPLGRHKERGPAKADPLGIVR